MDNLNLDGVKAFCTANNCTFDAEFVQHMLDYGVNYMRASHANSVKMFGILRDEKKPTMPVSTEIAVESFTTPDGCLITCNTVLVCNPVMQTKIKS